MSQFCRRHTASGFVWCLHEWFDDDDDADGGLPWKCTLTDGHEGDHMAYSTDGTLCSTAPR